MTTITTLQLAGIRRAGIFRLGEITFESQIPVTAAEVKAINKELQEIRELTARQHTANQLRLLSNVLNAEISDYDAMISLLRDKCPDPEMLEKPEADRADLDYLRTVYELEIPRA